MRGITGKLDLDCGAGTADPHAANRQRVLPSSTESVSRAYSVIGPRPGDRR
ncbi:hypothetical protein [Bradyrhizobium sp. BWA-3-5]|uniref:hypothetical protein n=1 Tax=Bradyrhizobium sp. BWA-3-5 TaxID=3080013 RepID=UPI00293EF783|nr:hypothetical protein [Bradyrhizobium sp. BWA-3-5]WOH67828.1 hypothetical protein RX331_08865 [Bradyrhizobium sp. BWA-3-5]